MSNNLGTYLGTPLIHGRKSKGSYDYLIEKVKRKLSGWKARFLSLAGRQTLVKSVASTIPNYVMQTSLLSSSTCCALDKVNRNFLWGDTETTKKTHLVKWDTVCSPKSKGGLRIRSAHVTNKAIVSKLGWSLMKNKVPLWVEVIRGKYGGEKNPRFWRNKKSASHIWRDIIKCKEVISDNTKWVVGIRESISIWNDKWCGDYRIADIISLNNEAINDDIMFMKVADLIEPGDMGWNTTRIDHLIPSFCKSDICNTPLPVCNIGGSERNDSPSWLGSSSGKFSIKACYDALTMEEGVEEEDWLWLWKFQIPQKLILFLWTIRHGKNLTNHQRLMRGMTNMGTCKYCGAYEDNDHIFRFCNRVNMVWNSYTTNLQAPTNANLNFRSWLDSNVRRLNCDTNNYTANVNFISVLWSIWKARNRFQFDNVLTRHDQILKESSSFSKEVIDAFHQSFITSSTGSNLIHWKFPVAGTVKVNTDGSCLGNPGLAGIGGIARNDQGQWLAGFAGFIGKATILKAELWAVREAVLLIEEKKWIGATVEVDSSNVIELIEVENCDDHPQRILIQDCKKIIEEMDLQVSHTLREGNRCADAMAKLGVNQMQRLEVFHHVPLIVKSLLEADSMGVCYPRGS